jgi:hypothetical protein
MSNENEKKAEEKNSAPKKGVRPYVWFTRKLVEQLRKVQDSVGVFRLTGAVLAVVIAIAVAVFRNQDVSLKSNGLLEVRSDQDI